MLKNLAPKLLFYYSTLAAFFILLSSLFLESGTPVVFKVFYLPVTAYFFIEIIRHLRLKVSGMNKDSEVFAIPKGKEAAFFTFVFLFLLTLGVFSVLK